MTLVDLRSDTITRPTAGMRAAMAEAEVGDDVFGEDPTVNALQGRMAGLFGKDAGLFVPTGTMANLVALLASSQPGQTVILEESAHPYKYEGGNLALVGGLLTRTLRGVNGVLTAADFEPQIQRSLDHHFSQTAVLAIENTTNYGGGNLYSVDTMVGIRALADEYGLRVHCDGARIFNAVVESGVEPSAYGALADTVSVCFSKGLGTPAGSMILGDRATIDRCHRFRKLLGGGMRQSGILAAAANYALDHHVARLAEDHGRARAFREALTGVAGISFPLPNPTNIVFMDVTDAMGFVGKVGEAGVLMLPVSPARVRAVFHLDVDDRGLGAAVEACARAAG